MEPLHQLFESISVRADERFPLHLEMVLSTAERQYQAVTEDVSATGLLFTADELPPIGTNVEIKLNVPAAIMGGVDDVLIHCVGHIVRHQQTATKLMASAIIDEYHLNAEQL